MDHRHYSAGGVARELGVSISLLDKLERTGAVPRVARLEGSGRRLYSAADVETIRQVVVRRREARRATPMAS